VIWEFKFAEAAAPDVPCGGMGCFILLTKTSREGHDRYHTYPAYYLNEHPLEMEDCNCAAEHDDGCPTTGWFYDNSNFEYENCYYPVEGEIIAYAEIPGPDIALKLIMGGPW